MKHLFIFIFFFISTPRIWSDVYVIIYATHDGHTGHCGIAVDNYTIRVNEPAVGNRNYTFDSLKTGTLTYYDFWPMKDEYKGNYEGDVAPHYYKLPSNRYKQYISTRTLSDQGVPHKFGYPCDGLLSLTTSERQDFDIKQYLDDLLDRHRDFNAMHYNCGDFVVEALKHMTGESIYAKEFIIKNYATTPNELYKVLSARKDITIIKDAGDRVNGSFVRERVVDRYFPILNIFQLFILIPTLL